MTVDALRLEAVAFRYPQAPRPVGPVSLTLAAGAALLLADGSGSGKSTLARLAGGLIPHLYHGDLEGEVQVFGQAIAGRPLWQISEQVGLVFQNPAAQMLTSQVDTEIIFGLENLGLSAAEIRQRLTEALDRFDLGRLRDRPPQSLSGGEQQKLALACVLARRTPLLVLDEPLSMLDSTAAQELLAHLSELQTAGQSLLLCEHRLEYARQLPGIQTRRLGEEALAPVTAVTEPQVAPVEPFALVADQVTLQRGRQTVVADLSFRLAGGQIAALVGRNGVGKTTLLRALAGLQPYQGRIQLQRAGAVTAPRFSLVFQNPDVQLFQPTVRDEILFGLPRPALDWYSWLLHSLDLQRYEAVPPLLLSEGEKRRVTIATALMRQAAHGILLDEPSLGQDAQHKAVVLRTLKQLARAGYLVVIATHDLDWVRQADTLLLLGAGGLIAQDAPAAVLRASHAWQQVGLRLPDWITAGAPVGAPV